MHDLLELTEQLCAIPSVSGSEAAIADLVEASLRERAPQLEITRLGANVIAHQRGGGRRCRAAATLTRCVADGNAAPRRDGDTLHGLGAADMNGGLLRAASRRAIPRRSGWPT